MNIYLASGFNRRLHLRTLAGDMQGKGHNVTSGWIWINERPDRTHENWDMFASKIAAANFLDLLRSDALVVDTDGIRETNNGGTHFETGFMYARNKPVWIVGKRGNTFHWLPDMLLVKDYKELLSQL